MDVVHLSTKSARVAFEVHQIMEYHNEQLGKCSSKLSSTRARKRIERAMERLMRARQDLAAVLHVIDPDKYPHPGEKGATAYWGFPRELKKETP